MLFQHPGPRPQNVCIPTHTAYPDTLFVLSLRVCFLYRPPGFKCPEGSNGDSFLYPCHASIKKNPSSISLVTEGRGLLKRPRLHPSTSWHLYLFLLVACLGCQVKLQSSNDRSVKCPPLLGTHSKCRSL